MTKEEAIRILKSRMDGHIDTSYEWAETVRMAIKALEQESCDDAISRKKVIDTIYCECSCENLDIDFAKVLLLQRAIKALPPVTPQPCGDAVSRQAVLDMMQMRISGKELYKAVYNLPPVTPQPKMGRWINKASGSLIDRYVCSACDKEPCQKKYRNTWGWDFTRYCPNCGAKMEE